MKTVYHPADRRGHANHGWLDTYHSFSFADFYDPERIHFGMLRVLNDDSVAGGMGFGTHPHDNMEIISIPLKGALEHQDSMGNKHVISAGEVQVMSAGTGVMHSEKNKDHHETVNFLQIWILPRLKNIEPRYDQRKFDFSRVKNDFLPLISPDGENDTLHINQYAWFYYGALSQKEKLSYNLKKTGHGVYIFVLEGELKVDSQILHRRDGLGISEATQFDLTANTETTFIVMEIPMF